MNLTDILFLIGISFALYGILRKPHIKVIEKPVPTDWKSTHRHYVNESFRMVEWVQSCYEYNNDEIVTRGDYLERVSDVRAAIDKMKHQTEGDIILLNHDLKTSPND